MKRIFIYVCIAMFFVSFYSLSLGETGFKYNIDLSWQKMTSGSSDVYTYGKGQYLRFIISQLNPNGDDALKWARDELNAIVSKSNGEALSEPKEVVLGKHAWIEIRSYQEAKGMKFLFIQWYLQNGPNLVEATLAGPQDEVNANENEIQTVLANVELLQR